MQNEINAKLLAQMGTAQIEENEVVEIIDALYKTMPCESEETCDYERLFAANRLSRANKTVMDKLKKIVYNLMKGPKGYESVTRTIGSRMFKLYYSTTSDWRNVHLPELKEEQLQQMTDEERKWEQTKRQTLAEWHRLNQEISDTEALLAPKKLELAGKTKALEAFMPTSKCIKRTPVIQVTQAVMD